MYQTLPHQSIVRESDEEVVCARCGLLNPGEDDPCITVLIEAAQPKPEKKAA
jgi:hypothetical protein